MALPLSTSTALQNYHLHRTKNHLISVDMNFTSSSSLFSSSDDDDDDDIEDALILRMIKTNYEVVAQLLKNRAAQTTTTTTTDSIPDDILLDGDSVEDSPKHTCLKLEIPTRNDSEPRDSGSIFVKGTWYSSRFKLAITNGLDAWTCSASEEEVKDRASQWDQLVSKYIDLAEKYLRFQQPGSVYGFSDAGNGHKWLTWAFEKEGTKLEWRWKCQPSASSELTTASVLDFLMDTNIRISKEAVRKADVFEKLKAKAEKCSAQVEKLTTEKAELESKVYPKCLGLPNTKKAKLGDLHERLSKQTRTAALPEDEDEDEDEDADYKLESLDEESDEGKKSEEEPPVKALIGTSKHVSRSTPQVASASRPCGRKRK